MYLKNSCMWVGICMFLASFVLLGCTPTAPSPNPGKDADKVVEKDEPAWRATAKRMENGEKLQSGQSKEVDTGSGIVIVSKNEKGEVSYTLK